MTELTRDLSHMPIGAIMLMSDCTQQEECLQLFSDLLISVDGIPGSVRQDEPQFVDLYTNNSDLLFSASFDQPRMGGGVSLMTSDL